MLNAVGSLFAIPLWGYLADLYGRRRLIMPGCGIMVLYPFAYFAMIDGGVFALPAAAIILSGRVDCALLLGRTWPWLAGRERVYKGNDPGTSTAGGGRA